MDETVRNEEACPVDASVAVSMAFAELELLRAETSITLSQLQIVEQPAIHDLSPLGQRRL